MQFTGSLSSLVFGAPLPGDFNLALGNPTSCFPPYGALALFDVYGFFVAGEVGTAAASVAEPASAGLNRILWGAGEKEG